MKPPPANLRKRPRWSARGWQAGALFLQLLLAGRGYALDPAKDILQYNCQTWSRQNGLPVSGINAIAQTQDGYLWLGAAAGLVRFDGIDFKLLDLGRIPQVRNSIVTSLASAQAGGLWVGLENSAFGFHDGHTFSFRGKDIWGKVDMNMRSILESKDGTLWLAAERQASRLTRSGVYEEVLGTSSEAVIDILSGYEDSQGRVWFGTARNGVHYWQAGKMARLPGATLDAASVFSMAEDGDGQLWIGTSQGLNCYDANLQRKEMPRWSDEVRALLVDRHGVLWIGTSGRGLGRYQGGTYSFLRITDGLANDYVKALAEDREGSLWIGTRNGVSQLTDVKFPIHRAAEDPAVADALAVGPSRWGGVWIASSAGVAYFDGQTQTYSTKAGLPKSYVKRVFEAGNGDLYLVNGTHDLVVFSGEKVVARYAASNLVVGLAEDAHGVVVSVGPSLFRAGTNYFTPYAFTNGEPALGWVLNLAAGRDGAIWVACGAGIVRVQDGAFQQWGAAQGLSDSIVQWVCEDSDGVVWGGTLTGIVRLKDNQIRRITRENGLFDNNIYAILPDDLGNLWVDSGRGIFRVSRRGMNDFSDGKTNRVECEAYDGMESVKSTDKTVQEHVGCKTLDGRIWFPNSRGVVVIDPAHIPLNPIAPPVHIDRVRANGREIVRHPHAAAPPGKGELEFHFAALSFIAPHKIRFRYQLEGYDKDWVQAEDRRLAFYTNLKPGRYTFRVAAANADGVWNQAGDRFTLELLPHFYQTVWFYSLCGGLALAGLAGVYRWRVRLLRRKQQAAQKTRELLEAEVARRTAELARANHTLQAEVTQHTRTEADLRNAEARYRLLFEQSPDGIVILDPETARLREFNETAHRQLGYSREEFARLSIPDFDAAETPEETRAHIAKILHDGRGDFETRHRTRQGEIRHVQVTVRVIEVLGRLLYHCIFRDITERKKAEAVLAERAQLCALTADVGVALTHGLALPAMLQGCAAALVRQLDAAFARVWTLNEPAQVLELQASAGLYTHLDGPHGRVPVGKFKIGLIAQERKPHLTNQVQGDPRVGDPEWAKREGMVAFAGYPLLVDDRVVGVIALFARHPLPDTTLEAIAGIADGIALGIARMRTEAALRASEERMRVQTAALEAADNGVTITDPHGMIQWVNPAFTQLTGYLAEEAVGQHSRLLKSGRHPQSFYQQMWETLGEGRAWKGEIINRRKDGQLYHEEMTITPVRDAGGATTHFITIKQDISERKLAQAELENVHQQLVEASRRGGMAEIATNVLHNVGNVLNSVNISTGLLIESVKKSRAAGLARVVALLREHAHDLGEFITHDARGKHVPAHLAQLSEHLTADQAAIVSELDSLQRNVEHIKEIVAMQQNYATFGGVKEIISVVALVEDSLRLNEGALSRHGVEVIREFEPVPPMNVEKHKILQILVNLVRNAEFACLDSERADKRLTLRVTDGAGWVKISVTDNGIGIPPENLTRIFNHGFTTRKGGHGFGLHGGALAAKEMGGSLTAQSAGPGQGATFILELPLDRAAPAA